jgi:hypothetical protein
MQRERPARADIILASTLAALALVEVAVIDREPRGFVLAVLMSLPLACCSHRRSPGGWWSATCTRGRTGRSSPS